ncbi:MAG: transcriptional regulator [Bacteroidia bacterium]|jgi:HTH-type transcriptional regulator/antitoxin HigA
MSDFKVIKSKEQYIDYTTKLIKLWENPTDKNEDDRELLEVLIETWERENSKHEDADPVELIKFLMDNHNLKREHMMEILEISKSTLSKILSYKKGLSKTVIRKLSEKFKISQEAFNRPYPIKSEANKGHQNEKMMNTTKNLQIA